MCSPASFSDVQIDILDHPAPWGIKEHPDDWERRQLSLHLGCNFQVVRELEEDRTGIVFLARDVARNRLVAIKVLRAEFTGSADHRNRFRRDARTDGVSQASFGPRLGYGEVGELVYTILKHSQGESIADRGNSRSLEAENIRSERMWVSSGWMPTTPLQGL